MNRLALLVAASLALVPAAQAKQKPTPLGDALAAAVESGVPGALALSRPPGRPAVRLAAGTADRAKELPMTPGLRFRVGSVTKTFVATLVLQLVGAHVLTLDDTVGRWFPGLVPNADTITIRELLRHQSGLYDYTDDPRIFKPYLAGKLGYAWSPRALVKIAAEHPPLFAPGTDWRYSNTNYVVLGLIMEKAGRAPLATQLRKRILAPLGLRSTTFSPGATISGPHVHGYYGKVDVSRLSASWAWAAGAIVSTADDLARFYQALLGGKLLAPSRLHAMEQTVPELSANGDRYGLGIFRVQTPCGYAWGHNGLIPGYRTFVLASRDGKRLAVVAEATSAPTATGPQDQAFDELAAAAYCG